MTFKRKINLNQYQLFKCKTYTSQGNLDLCCKFPWEGLCFQRLVLQLHKAVLIRSTH